MRVTTTMAGGQAAESSGGAPLVVRPSRRRVHREMAFTAGWILLGLLVFVVPDGFDRSLGADLALFVGVPLGIGLQARTWRRLLGVDVVLEIGPAGVRVHHLGHGWLVLPWSAVGSIGPDSMYRTVVVRPAAGVDPSTPGTTWPDTRLIGLRSRFWGWRVPLRPTDTTMGQVAAALRHHRPAS